MKVLLYGINYSPDLTGIGKYSGEMGEWLARQGHDVRVITAYHYYPDWKIREANRGLWWRREHPGEREEVIRCPLYVPGKVTAVKRILHEFSFVLTSSIALLACLFKKTDVVVNVVTPFHLGIPARLFAWIKRVPMVYHVQDLQVDAAHELGMINNPLLLSIMKQTESWILRKADRVTTISEGMMKKIEGKGISPEKITFFPNWVDGSAIYPLKREASLRQELGFDDSDKIVLYAGNLGEKQGLEAILEVAAALQDRKDIYFAIVGNGGTKDKLMNLAQKRNLYNVRFFPLQPYEKLSALLAMADIHLVLQKRAAADLVMPSKFTSILAAGGCALVTADKGTTLYETISAHRIAVVIEPESTRALQQGILEMLTGNAEPYRINARNYALQYLDKDNILRAFETELYGMLVHSEVQEVVDSISQSSTVEN